MLKSHNLDNFIGFKKRYKNRAYFHFGNIYLLSTHNKLSNIEIANAISAITAKNAKEGVSK